MSPIRKHLGLRWKSHRFTLADFDRLSDAVAIIFALIALLLAYGFLQAHDDAVTAEIEARKSSQAFTNFLNGAALVDQAGKFAARCQLIEVTQ